MIQTMRFKVHIFDQGKPHPADLVRHVVAELLELRFRVYQSSYTTQMTFPSPTDDWNEKYFDLYAATNIGFGKESYSQRSRQSKEGERWQYQDM